MELKKGKALSEGNSKKVYSTSDPDYNILLFKDIFKQKIIKNFGKNNAAISSTLFKLLKSYHVPTHFIRMTKPNEMIVKNLNMIPVEIHIWNYVSKTFYKRFDQIGEGEPLPSPVVEMYLKKEKHQGRLVNFDHVCAFKYATADEIKIIDNRIRKINAILKSFFHRRHLKLVRFSLEFGRFHDHILLADEI